MDLQYPGRKRKTNRKTCSNSPNFSAALAIMSSADPIANRKKSRRKNRRDFFNNRTIVMAWYTETIQNPSLSMPAFVFSPPVTDGTALYK